MAGRISYTGGIVRNGLVLHLDAAKRDSYPKTGTIWTDLSGNGNNGTLANSPTFNISNGGSLVFDGTNQYGNSNSGISNNSSFSVNFWMKYLGLSVPSVFKGILTTWDTSWGGFGIAMTPTNLRSWCNNGAGGGMNWVTYDSLYNVWANITLVYNFSNKTQYGYVNGVLRNSETFGTTITHSTLQISRGGQTGSTQLSIYGNSNMLLSNIQIYNRALSDTEILQNYNALKGRYI